MSGHLYYGDNLQILREYIADDSVDLIYLDPPFNSKRDYNVLFGKRKEEAAPASQIQAFKDTWTWDTTARLLLQEVVEAHSGEPVAEVMLAFQKMLGPSDILAYLSNMAPRLIELRRVLRDTGSIYLHCDPTASHYLKLLLDAIFGTKNFRNEIIWPGKYGSRGKRDFGRKHQVILRYSKTNDWFFNPKAGGIEHEAGSLKHNYRFVDEDGRRYRKGTWPSGKEYRYYADEGRSRDDIWADIEPLHPQSKERRGYDTQKPVALLELIIASSSEPGDTVLDPFCGCGTTIEAAAKLDRNWIGIDITHIAVDLIQTRLAELGLDDYKLTGEPMSLEDARLLADEDTHQFELWAVSRLGAWPGSKNKKKGSDGGIDWRIYYFDGADEPKQVILSVKSGKVGVSMLRDLEGVVAGEGAEFGVLITLQEPTKPMTERAASSDIIKSPYGNHQKIQIITIAELLDGRLPDLPPEAFKRTDTAGPTAPTEKTSGGVVEGQLRLEPKAAEDE